MRVTVPDGIKASGKVRRTPPVIGNRNGKSVGVLTAQQIDAAMFGRPVTGPRKKHIQPPMNADKRR